MKLTEIKRVEGTITLLSGLHIGSGNMEMHIGGTDSPVIKHPHTLEPYIPGSSLKGKVRSLLEMESGLMIYTNGDVVSGKVLQMKEVAGNPQLRAKGEAIVKIFGSSGADIEDETSYGPTRASFADCYLNQTWKKQAHENRWLWTEEKPENVIDRIKGTVSQAGVRFIERVPAGAQFDFVITFKILQEGDTNLFEYLLKGLKLLEYDTLGGNGSRGYGRIAFRFDDEALHNAFQTLKPF